MELITTLNNQNLPDKNILPIAIQNGAVQVGENTPWSPKRHVVIIRDTFDQLYKFNGQRDYDYFKQDNKIQQGKIVYIDL